MRRSAFFWGAFLILIGALLLLWNLDVITFNVWETIGPLFLILFGALVLIGIFRGRKEVDIEHVSVPLEGAAEAHIDFNHGIGLANLTGSSESGMLMSGEFGGGLKWQTGRDGSRLRLSMKMPDLFVPSFWPIGPDLRWDFGLTKDIPLTLKVNGGAGILDFDLSDLRVLDLDFDSGVGAAKLTLPAAAGRIKVNISGGVGTLTILIPEGVAASIRTTGGIGAISVNRSRFPRTDERRYESPDYSTAENKIDLRVNGGVGTIAVR